MSRTYVQPGDVMEFTAPNGGVTAGTGLLIGGLFVVPQDTKAATLSFRGMAVGVHTLAKTSAQAWAEGDKIYFNTSTNVCSSDATTGPLIGVAAAAAANPSSTGVVRLNGGAASTAEGPQATIAAVATADADGTYGSPEATLINELKTQLNSVITALKAAGIVAAS